MGQKQSKTNAVFFRYILFAPSIALSAQAPVWAKNNTESNVFRVFLGISVALSPAMAWLAPQIDTNATVGQKQSKMNVGFSMFDRF